MRLFYSFLLATLCHAILFFNWFIVKKTSAITYPVQQGQPLPQLQLITVFSDNSATSVETTTSDALEPKPLPIQSPKISETKPSFKPEMTPISTPHKKQNRSVTNSKKTNQPANHISSDNEGIITLAQPDYLKNPAPLYPEVSRQKQQEGTVLIDVHVSTDGEPLEVKLQQSSQFPLLDKAALQAVQRWRFKPARQGNQPIDSFVQIPIQFQLSGAR